MEYLLGYAAGLLTLINPCVLPVLPIVLATALQADRRGPLALAAPVLDGRDIGTVICPEAEAKLFVIAGAEVRAERRWRELVASGHEITQDEVLADVLARDQRDMNRADAPLKPAEDAVTLDTSKMDIADAVAEAIAIVERAGAAG